MLARIENGTILETRNIALNDVPEHKRYLWLPVVYEGDGPQSQTIIEAAQVRIVKSYPPLTADDFAEAIQAHIDATAQAKGYADGVALAGYSTSTIQSWAAEAAAFVAWRDQVWLYAYGELAKVQGGQREVPTVAELIGELQPIVWP